MIKMLNLPETVDVGGVQLTDDQVVMMAATPFLWVAAYFLLKGGSWATTMSGNLYAWIRKEPGTVDPILSRVLELLADGNTEAWERTSTLPDAPGLARQLTGGMLQLNRDYKKRWTVTVNGTTLTKDIFGRKSDYKKIGKLAEQLLSAVAHREADLSFKAAKVADAPATGITQELEAQAARIIQDLAGGGNGLTPHYVKVSVDVPQAKAEPPAPKQKQADRVPFGSAAFPWVIYQVQADGSYVDVEAREGDQTGSSRDSAIAGFRRIAAPGQYSIAWYMDRPNASWGNRFGYLFRVD